MEPEKIRNKKVDDIIMRRTKILITGAGSYIGNSIQKYFQEEVSNQYEIDVFDTKYAIPDEKVFYGYEIVFNVAGIAHEKESDKNRNLYYRVNRDMCIDMAEKAKKAGIKHFIVLSSMSVYGRMTGHITKETKPVPNSAYGDSKYQADLKLQEMSGDEFKVAILRPPMVYGKDCKGNYQQLRRFALKSPIFPSYKNQRSMIYIGNLCEFVKNVVDERKEGIFFPQNAEFVNTSDMVKCIAKENGHRILLVSFFNVLIRILHHSLIRKVFGNLTYEKCDLVNKYSFEESIRLSER